MENLASLAVCEAPAGAMAKIGGTLTKQKRAGKCQPFSEPEGLPYLYLSRRLGFGLFFFWNRQV